MFGIFRYVLAMMVTSGHLHTQLFGRPNWLGWYAVFAFFTLSGYLMTRVLHETYGYGPLPFARFVANRALRIYPPYWAAMLATIALLVSYPDVAGPMSGLIYLPVDTSGYVQNAVIVGIDNRYTPALVPPAWSLHVELVFYLLMALGLSRFKPLTLLWLIASAAWTLWTVWAGVEFGSRFSTLLGASLAFSVGAATWYYQDHRRAWMRLAPVLFLPHALAAPFLWPGDVHLAGFYASFALVPLCVMALSDWHATGLLARVDRWCGELSYPVFLLHTQAGLFMTRVWPFPIDSWLTAFLIALPLLHVSAVLLHLATVYPLEAWRRRIRQRAAPA